MNAPEKTTDLALLKLLHAYGDGTASWRDRPVITSTERAECNRLYGAIVAVIDSVLAPLLNRVNAQDMRTFTMHDAFHGLKVASLIWEILDEGSRKKLSPVDIALLVLSAYIHDLGMWISDEERTARLNPSSDLWRKLDATGDYRKRLAALANHASLPDSGSQLIGAAAEQLFNAQEVLLCIDTRERHALPSRYRELLEGLRSKHALDRVGIPSIDEALHFGPDSFEGALIEVCVSHGEDAACLLETLPPTFSSPRFPRQFPVSTCQADMRLVAASLRIADILDFDRERAPRILYQYLLPRSASPANNISVREWQKHFTISNWLFDNDRIVFRGRSSNPYAHHSVLQFCKSIQDELERTRATFADDDWPFVLSQRVDTEIFPDGFRYIPFQFRLQEEKIFSLLMGRNIYKNPFDAVRELVQNAVDACQFKDALLCAYQPSVVPSTSNRLVISFHEPRSDDDCPKLSIADTGTGMDLWVIENYLLKVGESYYTSSEFLRTTGALWEKNIRFSPVSEFGIGFISAFILADHVEVDTAMLKSPRKDTVRRIMSIDGIGRLIHLTESKNEGYEAQEGTCVTLYLRHGSDQPDWDGLRRYVRRSCVRLPYSLNLKRISPSGEVLDSEIINPVEFSIELAPETQKIAHRIPVHCADPHLAGEIILFEEKPLRSLQEQTSRAQAFRIEDDEALTYGGFDASILLRGGFSIGTIPGLPDYIGFVTGATGRVEVLSPADTASLPVTDLARTSLANNVEVEGRIIETWLGWMLRNPDLIETLHFGPFNFQRGTASIERAAWLEQFSAFDVYRIARYLWSAWLGDDDRLLAWEQGEGPSLPLGIFDTFVHRALLTLILPRICKLNIGSEAKPYVSPPVSGWQEDLKGWFTYVSEPIKWSRFAHYIQSVRGLLWFEYSGSEHLNVEYMEALNWLSEKDAITLMAAFKKLVMARDHGYQAELSKAEELIFHKAAALLPHAEVGSIRGRYSLGAIRGNA